MHEQAEFGSTLTNTMNQNNSLGVTAMLSAVQRIEHKPFKATTIEVAYAKRDMSKRWNGSQINCMTHSSLWADLGTIMMDGMVDLRSGSVE